MFGEGPSAKPGVCSRGLIGWIDSGQTDNGAGGLIIQKERQKKSGKHCKYIIRNKDRLCLEDNKTRREGAEDLCGRNKGKRQGKARSIEEWVSKQGHKKKKKKESELDWTMQQPGWEDGQLEERKKKMKRMAWVLCAVGRKKERKKRQGELG